MTDEKSVRILIASDHYGLSLKNPIRDYLIEKGYDVEDMGVHNEEPVLYPEVAIQFSKKLLDEKFSRGVLICGTGAGMAVVANKIPGVRAVCINDTYTAERARASNDAQVATMGSQVVGIPTAKKLIDIWLESEFQGGRSLPKVQMIYDLDSEKEKEIS